jgi:hypothetical protein
MSFMYEETLLAHALRDYLRPLAGESEVKWMDFCLSAGEPVAALKSGLGIAQEFAISLPPIFETKILTLECLNENDVSFISQQFSTLPAWWELAS